MRRLSLLGLALLLEVWALAVLDPLPGADLARHVLLFLGAWVAYVAALRVVLGLPPQGRRADLTLIFVGAVLLRATLLLTPPSLSDDIFRAIWDARLLHSGVNPYTYAPADPETLPYRDSEFWPRINHKEQRTPYPPMAEVLGGGAYALLPERALAFQGLAAGFDLLAAGLLAWLLHRLREDPRRCVALAWSPAGVLHFAHSGHNDAVMVAGMVGAALLLTFGYRRLSMAALAAATMVKVVPVLAAPAFARAAGWSTLVLWAATCLFLALPFVGAGAGLARGVLEEGAQARFNDSLRLVLERAGRPLVGEAASGLALAATAGMVLAAAAAAARWGDPSPRGALVAGCRVLGVYLLAAPVVQPWYGSWLAPLIALEMRPGRGLLPFSLRNDVPAWLWLTGLAVLTDLTYGPGGTELWVPIRAVEYGPVYGLLAIAGWQKLSETLKVKK